MALVRSKAALEAFMKEEGEDRPRVLGGWNDAWTAKVLNMPSHPNHQAVAAMADVQKLNLGD